MSKKTNKNKPLSKPLNDDAPAKREPLVVYYDENGTKIGDDGYPMTPVRKRMHTVFNLCFFWGVIVLVWALFCCVFSYFQNQSYSFYELVATGGTQLNGWDLAFILRMEALFGLFSGVLLFPLNLFGFHWFYDGEPSKKIKIILLILGVASLAFLGASVAMVGMPSPISLGNILLVAACAHSMGAVTVERPTLKKAKPASKVVKR